MPIIVQANSIESGITTVSMAYERELCDELLGRYAKVDERAVANYTVTYPIVRVLNILKKFGYRIVTMVHEKDIYTYTLDN